MGEKIDPWGSIQVEDYKETVKKFGIESLKDAKELRDNKLFRRNIVYGHRDFDKILDAIRNRKEFAMMTGMMPSGKFHFGHKLVADQIKFFQDKGAEIYIAVADVEAYLTRDMPLEKSREIALNQYLKNYIALGIDPEKINFYFQSEGSSGYNTRSKLFSKNVTQNELEAIYGELSPNKTVSVLTQAADILKPQFSENGGPRPVVVPVGIDQDPHIRLTRDIASRYKRENFVKPSSIYNKFMRGLQGGKMSSSDPKSHISLDESVEKAKKKIDAAKTGGKQSLEEHREKGADVEEDIVFELLAFHLIDDDKELRRIYKEYNSGEMLSGELKMIAKDKMEDFLVSHHRKLGEAEEKVEEMFPQN